MSTIVNNPVNNQSKFLSPWSDTGELGFICWWWKVIEKKVDGVDTYYIESVVISKYNLSQITKDLHLYTEQQIFGKN